MATSSKETPIVKLGFDVEALASIRVNLDKIAALSAHSPDRANLFESLVSYINFFVEPNMDKDLPREFIFVRDMLVNPDGKTIPITRLREFLPVYYEIAVVREKFKNEPDPVCRRLTRNDITFLLTTAQFNKEQLKGAFPSLEPSIPLKKFIDWWCIESKEQQFCFKEAIKIIKVMWKFWNSEFDMLVAPTKVVTQTIAGFISAAESIFYLDKKSPGTFMIRFSLSGGFGIEYVQSNGEVGKTQIDREKCLTSALDVIINTDDMYKGLTRLYSRSSAIPKAYIFK